MTGYKLIEALRYDAEECQNPDRARLLLAAADEIEALIIELRKSEPKRKP